MRCNGSCLTLPILAAVQQKIKEKIKKKERKKENAATVFGSKGKDTWFSIAKVTPQNDKAPIENCQEKKKSFMSQGDIKK